MTQTDTTDWDAWQQQWDAQQEAYLPDREQRFAAMLDTVEATLLPGEAPGGQRHQEAEATAGEVAPRILDLAGGTGSITRRLLWRFPQASAVVLDIDAALLAIARGTFADDPRVRVARVDLGHENWPAELASEIGAEVLGSFDAVLTATALHWLTADRVAGVYAEARPLLCPGGVFINADYMTDPGLPSLTAGLERVERRERLERWSRGVPSWEAWWELLRADPQLAGATAERDAFYAERRGDGHTESLMSSAWHLEAMRAGGYAETGLVWRGLLDAAATGRTAPA
ncbi:class I SAM-dependent methyltransferase [Kineosporia sp. J2-2]|uniref:Class I SAM-dependent methyltransferase n=1 Tax=Kineosporia corallincola TaxID=2835133 RepID=A0ABS5TDV5_9ACTN|nr:class I SAM-dependent methyltransferase [Kineosporia corallincola]MBT0769221.1 class I SAM-dependent methyltransferase [Kineosporia corallincola]